METSDPTASSRRARTAGAPSAHLEREAKLDAPLEFALPELGGAGATVGTKRARRLESTYWDTADLRLLRWGCTLRHRRGEGWTVKLPATSLGVLLARTEHTFAAPPTSPPAEALDLVLAYTRREPVVPVARMVTRRRAVRLTGPDGGTGLASVPRRVLGRGVHRGSAVGPGAARGRPGPRDVAGSLAGRVREAVAVLAVKAGSAGPGRPARCAAPWL